MSVVRKCCLLAVACAPMDAFAAGTPAGTSIQNTAQVTFELNGAPHSVSSNVTSIGVAEVIDAVITLDSPQASVSPGLTRAELVFTLTNTGNGPESFILSGLSAGLAGDDFDPQLSAPALYFDTDASGDLSADDVEYVPGSNDPLLNADASVRVLLVNDIPSSVTGNQRGRSQLSARASTGTGDPGTVISGAGAGGFDAIIGNTRAQPAVVGEYVVAGLQVVATKAQTIDDGNGGARAIRGARINYSITILANGTGTARDAVFNDALPAGTSYVADSLRFNNTALTDTADDDAGEFLAAPAPQIRVQLGDLSASSGAQTVEFAVTIN